MNKDYVMEKLAAMTAGTQKLLVDAVEQANKYHSTFFKHGPKDLDAIKELATQGEKGAEIFLGQLKRIQHETDHLKFIEKNHLTSSNLRNNRTTKGDILGVVDDEVFNMLKSTTGANKPPVLRGVDYFENLHFKAPDGLSQNDYFSKWERSQNRDMAKKIAIRDVAESLKRVKKVKEVNAFNNKILIFHRVQNMADKAAEALEEAVKARNATLPKREPVTDQEDTFKQLSDKYALKILAGLGIAGAGIGGGIALAKSNSNDLEKQAGKTADFFKKVSEIMKEHKAARENVGRAEDFIKDELKKKAKTFIKGQVQKAKNAPIGVKIGAGVAAVATGATIHSSLKALKQKDVNQNG